MALAPRWMDNATSASSVGVVLDTLKDAGTDTQSSDNEPVDGEVILAWVVRQSVSSGSLSGPSGWTKVNEYTEGNFSGALFKYVWTSGDVPWQQVSFTWSGGLAFLSVMVVATGQDASSNFYSDTFDAEVVAESYNYSTTDFAPAITTNSSNARVFAAILSNYTTYTGAGHDNNYSAVTTQKYRYNLAYQDKAVAGAIGANTPAGDAANHHIGWTVALAPLGGGGSTDALTGQDITVGTPALDSPTLGQEHALTGQEITLGVTALDSATLGQEHALTGQDITVGAPAFDSPTLGQTAALTGQDITVGAPALDSPTLGQEHALTGQDITAGAPALDSPTLGQEHALTGQDITVGAPALDSPTLGQEHALTGQDITVGAPVLDSPTLGQEHVLTGQDITVGAPTLDSPTIASEGDLLGQDITIGAPVLDSPILGQEHALTGQDITVGAPALDSPALSTDTGLIGQDITVGAPALDSPTLGQGHALTGQDITVGAPVLDSATLGQGHALTGQDITVGAPVLGSPTLEQITALTGQDIIIGAPALNSPMLEQIHVLESSDLTILPTIDAPALGQVHDLVSQDLLVGAPLVATATLASTVPVISAEDVMGMLSGLPLAFVSLASSYPIDTAESNFFVDEQFFDTVLGAGISVKMFVDSTVPVAWVIGTVNRGSLGMRVPSGARGRKVTEQPGMNVKRDGQSKGVYSDDEVTTPSEGPKI